MGAVSLNVMFVFFGFQAALHVRGEPRPQWMKDTLTSHFSEPRHHVTNPQYKIMARNFIDGQFRNSGLTTVSHNFDTRAQNVTGVTVIGVLKGIHFNTANDSIVAVSAHYDTMRYTPGVNDNGAAVVIMLEAARELSQGKPRNSTLLFIAFDFEEYEKENNTNAACTRDDWLCGSTKLVKDWLPSYFQSWPVQWKGLANMDTVLNFDDRNNTQAFPSGIDLAFPEILDSVNSDGKEGDFLTVAGRTPDDATIMTSFNKSWFQQGRPDFEIEVFPLTSDILAVARDFKRSDHSSFWNKNLSALFLTDTANFRGYMRKCYHAGCDNITFATDKRMEFAAKISSAVITWVNDLAPVVDVDTGVASLPSANKLLVLLTACGVLLVSWSFPRHTG